MKKMLLVFAHPDDETFAVGGTVAKYINTGWEACLVCATSGQDGNRGGYESLNKIQFGEIRKSELEAAAQTIGIAKISFLDYPDGGLAQTNSGELEDRIYKEMLSVSPNVVITFAPNGISNHPDHVKICYAATFAFQKYASEIVQTKQFIEKLNKPTGGLLKRHFLMKHRFALKQKSFDDVIEDPHQPKLYYVCAPESIISFMIKIKALPKESFGKPWQGTADKAITTVIDISRQQRIKIQALLCHKSQEQDVKRYISHPLLNPFLKQEHFILRMQGETEIFMGKRDHVSDRL